MSCDITSCSQEEEAMRSSRGSHQSLPLSLPRVDARAGLGRWRKVAPVFTSILANLLLTANQSLTVSSFPNVAHNKGLSKTKIGMVIGAVDLASLLFSVPINNLIHPGSIRFWFLAAVAGDTFLNLSFAYMALVESLELFFYLTLLNRALTGITYLLMAGTMLSVATQSFPEKSASIYSIISLGIGVGLVLGPVLGATFDSFQTPFLLVNAAAMIFLFLNYILIPKAKEKSAESALLVPENKQTYSQFLLRKRTLGLMLPYITFYFIPGVTFSAYTIFLKEQLGVSENTASLAYAANPLAFLISSPLIAIPIKAGYVSYLTIWAFVCATSALYLLYLPSRIPQIEVLPWFVLIAASFGAMIAINLQSLFLLLEKIAISEGFQNRDKIKSMVGSTFVLIRTTGIFLGASVLGGVVYDHLGLYTTCLISAPILAISSIFLIVYLTISGLTRPIRYG